MTEQTTPRQLFMDKISNSWSLRAVFIALLVALMFLPLMMVTDMVKERHHYHQTVLEDIASTWGGSQTVTGPIMVIPYTEHFTSVDTVTDKDGESRVVSKDIYSDHTAILLPENLDLRADIKEEHKERGLYNALVYNVNLSLAGKFDFATIQNNKEGDRKIAWDKARIVVGLSDTKAITTISSLSWGEKRTSFEPGAELGILLENGIHAPIPAPEKNASASEFKITMTLRGSDGFYFAPVGRVTNTRMTSPWMHPSFQGDILPSNHDINEQGFSAEWEISHLARHYPQTWVIDDKQTYNFKDLTVGVRLHEADTLYTKVLRAVKYAILFIALTFITLFAFEISLRQRFHILHYVMVGGAMALFYLMLLALAEHIGFLYAYLAAAGTTITLISSYIGNILKSFWRALIIFVVLVSIYAVLYLILQMEDYALLAGVGVLAVAVALMMFVTQGLQRETPLLVEPINDMEE